MDFQIKHNNSDAQVCVNKIMEKDGICFYEFIAEFPQETIPEQITLSFSIPSVEIYSVWSPAVRYDRHIGAPWSKRTTAARLSSGMPIHTLLSATGKNSITVAISDAETPTSIKSGVCEETANLDWEIDFFTIKVAPLKKYKAIIRIDRRDIVYYDAIYDVVNWWENECGYKPAYVPEYAKLPMNSLWYSYHQQLDVDDIVKECALSHELGMDTVIIDDGWQTDDNNRGYQFCGDWEVATSKIPDMRNFIDRIHQTGMKAMLWYSVPFVGKFTKAYAQFSDMILDETGDNSTFWALDPRYKQVREYLIDIYSKALTEWKLDGLKLDFIDWFLLKGRSLEYDSRRDYQSLEEAVDRLLTDVTDALRAINPDVLIEFRQTYVGPAIRKYGNMLRVGDCPNDAIRNRQDIVDLRFTSGNTAVHSDMLLWNKEDTVESAAMQVANVLYSVPQISVKIANIPDEHKKMLKHYLGFWRENRDVLINGKILAQNPESAYSIVCAQKGQKAIFTAYTKTVIDCSKYEDIVAVNCTPSKHLLIKGAEGKKYKVVNCMGDTLYDGQINAHLYEIEVPLTAMIFVK